MPSGLKKQRLSKRQSASGGLSRRSPQKVAVRRRRVKRLRFPLGFSSQLVISLRRFRTNKNRRSKRYRQVVFPIKLGSFREIALAEVRRKHNRRYSSKHRQDRTFFWLPRQVVAPLVLVALIVNGVAFSSLYFNKSDKHEIIPSGLASASQTLKDKPAKLSQVMPRSEPIQLRIPKIGVDTALIQTGRATDGTLQMPERYDVAAWYQYSPTPGELGPAVIVGHVDNYRGVGVFWRLRELLPGDTVEVDRADGTTANFMLTALAQYHKDNFPTQEVYGNINYAGIRLITCGGVFDSQTYQYTDNIVAYGKLVD